MRFGGDMPGEEPGRAQHGCAAGLLNREAPAVPSADPGSGVTVTGTPLRPASSATVEAPTASVQPEMTGRQRRPWITAGVLAAVALGSGLYVMGRAGDLAAPAAAPIGSARRGSDGSFAFTVAGTTCGVTSVGPSVLAQRPTSGQFCLVNLSVHNTGTEPELLDPGAQHAIDDQGREYPVSDRAAVFLNDGKPTLLDEIPAGATVPGVLPFDLPAGARIDAIVLHDSITSTGVRVALSS